MGYYLLKNTNSIYYVWLENNKEIRSVFLYSIIPIQHWAWRINPTLPTGRSFAFRYVFFLYLVTKRRL